MSAAINPQFRSARLRSLSLLSGQALPLTQLTIVNARPLLMSLQVMLPSVRLAIALFAATVSYSSLPARAADLPAPAATPPSFMTESAEVGLARHLTKMGVKVYGSETCPFTRLQRQLFGEAGFKQLNYIECSPNAQQAQLGLCRAIQLQQTPTWEINGRLYQGVRALDQLARLSHYSGATNFLQARPLP